MKRNWETIRYILTALEEAPSHAHDLSAESFRDVPPEEAHHHIEMLIGHELITASDRTCYLDALYPHYTNLRPTMTGYELLDSIRNDTVWEKTKDAFKSKGLPMTIEGVLAVTGTIISSLLTSALS